MTNIYKFRTTVKCDGCVNTITPALNKLEGIEKWEVDLTSPERILTVFTHGISPEEIIQAMTGVGYKAELISE